MSSSDPEPAQGAHDHESAVIAECGFVDDAAGRRAVHSIILRSIDGVEVHLVSYGAGITAVHVPDAERPGSSVEITCPPTDLGTLQTVAGRYVGASIGRFANRIAGASFELDGARFELDANEKPNHLHGGSLGFHSQVWEHELLADGTGVRFWLVSPDGEGGYPGTVTAEAIYRLGGRRLVIEYRATTDAATPLNLTNHAYWNLAGAESSETIEHHRLTLGFDRVLLTDEADIPQAGPPVEAAGTRFALDGSADLSVALAAGGIDHCYVGKPGGDQPVVILEHPASGRRLSIVTDQPGVQVYTGQHFVPPHLGIAFEPQGWPDSPNRPDFPSAILRPGETYQHRSAYLFDW